MEKKENIGEDTIYMEKGSSKKGLIFAIFILLALNGVAGYFVYDRIQENIANNNVLIYQEAFKNGVSFGAESLLLEVFAGVATCMPLPINNGTTELTLIARECLTGPLP